MDREVASKGVERGKVNHSEESSVYTLPGLLVAEGPGGLAFLCQLQHTGSAHWRTNQMRKHWREQEGKAEIPMMVMKYLLRKVSCIWEYLTESYHS